MAEEPAELSKGEIIVVRTQDAALPTRSRKAEAEPVDARLLRAIGSIVPPDLPPISQLTPDQAMYHFLSGFTSKVAGTERGVTEPEPTFSTCFGAPFMPRRPEVYGNLLREKIAAHGATCWLVNTGWTGGAYGTGSRMPIKATRALLTAALEGALAGVEYRKDPNFGFDVPVAVTGVADILLDPRRTWDNPESYDRQADKLVKMFAENFEQYLPYIDDDVKAAAIG